MKSIRIPAWAEILDPSAPWGLLLRSGTTGLWLLRHTAEEEERLSARVVAGRACATSAALFDEWAVALDVEDVPRDWGALRERMRDVESPYAVLVTDAELVLDDEPRRLPAFLGALRVAAENAASADRVVRFVFQSRFDHDAERLAIYHEHGVVDIV